MLDVGCGVGTITADVASAVTPGCVLGIDRDESLIEIARSRQPTLDNLSFHKADVLALDIENVFNVATAARTLQWVSDPGAALRRMRAAVRPGGLVVVLDYNHESSSWYPEPPRRFREFYRAFLDWRASRGWDNWMADHLPALFESAALSAITSEPQHEIAKRGDADFEAQLDIWPKVIESLGPQVAAHAAISPSELVLARTEYRHWVRDSAERQVLDLHAVVGIRPV